MRSLTPAAAGAARVQPIETLAVDFRDAGTVGLDGRMLDIPHLKAARAVLARAEAVITRPLGTRAAAKMG